MSKFATFGMQLAHSKSITETVKSHPEKADTTNRQKGGSQQEHEERYDRRRSAGRSR